jgi:hypothetical protein
MKVLRIVSILALALALFNGATSAQGDMDTWIANAQSFYAEGVDENALLGNQFNDFSAIMPGMLGPDFTLLDINGIEFSLSQYLGNSFVVLETGSWY